MKKIVTIILVLTMLLICYASAEDGYSRAKSLGITKTEWLNRYAAVPTIFATYDTPIYPVKLTEEDYRVYYIATPFDGVNVVLVCEDTTDYVLVATVMIDIDDLNNDYDLSYKIGRFINEFVRRSAFATNPDVSSDWVSDDLFSIIDTSIVIETNDVKNTIENNGIIYMFSYNDGLFTYGLKSVYVFNSEDEFIKYRNSTK